MTTSAASVSVVVPTFRRPGPLSVCLAALAALDYPPGRLEVIVVDDGGDVPLEPALAPHRPALRLRLVRQRWRGPAAARNAGAARAAGGLLAFTDDDCAPAPSWLAILTRRLRDEGCCAVGGRTVNDAGSRYARASQLITDLVYAHYNADPASSRFLASNNVVVAADDFRALGGFDESFRYAEDRDLCDRLLAEGCRLVYVPEAVVYHRPPLDLVGFCRQHLGYGTGAFRYHRERARRGSGSLAGELAFYLGLPRSAAAAIAAADRRAATAALLLLWQAANAAGFARAGARALGGRAGGAWHTPRARRDASRRIGP